MGQDNNMKFSMPMFREWVPEKVRPWMYLFFAFVFQLTGGIYLGSLAHMRGEMSLLREDILMCGNMGFIGLTLPFPLLFRFKFRFSNRKMLSISAGAILVCNILSLYVDSLPLLWTICFVSGWFKIWGTFECMSNIQLWIAPGRDFFRFFPILYTVVLSGVECSGIMAELAGYFLTWKYMPVIIVALLTLMIILLNTLTVDFRPGKPFPLYGIDWTGIVLWALLMAELSFIFIYGEHYNWWDGMPVRYAILTAAVTGFFCIGRMRHVRHPYIECRSWKYGNIAPAFIIFLCSCFISASSTVLESAFTGSVIPSGPMESVKMHIVKTGGVIAGGLFSLVCLKKLKLSLARLTISGLLAMTAYTFMMYFLIAAETAQHQIWLPAFLKQFGYAVLYSALTLYIQVQMPFQHFFQGLTIIGFARTVLGSVMGCAMYGYLMRWNMAGQTARLGAAADHVFMSSTGADAAAVYGELSRQAAMMSVKNLFGYTFIFSCALVLLMMLIDSPVRRRYVNIPDWETARKYLKKAQRASR